MTDQRAQTRLGVVYGVAAYLTWGFIPVYFKQVGQFRPWEVLGHRIVWSVVFAVIVLAMQRQWGELREMLRSRRTMLWLGASTVMLATNWFAFIWAVANNQVLEASLGYYANPLFSALLGFVFLRERLRKWQLAAMGLAAVAVAMLTREQGQLPWIALVLPGSWGLYGLLRKTAHVRPLVGTAAETMLLLPVGLGLVATGVWREMHEEVLSGGHAWLPVAGVVTMVPLLWFVAATQRLKLATIGIIQYISPTVNFLLAVFVYGEAFGRVQLQSFCLIWAAVAIYSVDSVRAYWREGREVESAEEMVKE